jgi:hypothetical protein
VFGKNIFAIGRYLTLISENQCNQGSNKDSANGKCQVHPGKFIINRALVSKVIGAIRHLKITYPLFPENFTVDTSVLFIPLLTI